MSIWGASPVENDDAADWLSEFSEAPTIVALTEAFDDIVNSGSQEYLEIPECAVSVVAATVVRDMFSPERSEYLIDEEGLAALRSLAKKLTPTARVALVKKALKSVKRVMLDNECSELFQLIQEDLNISKTWLHEMNNLVRDLDEIKKGLI